MQDIAYKIHINMSDFVAFVLSETSASYKGFHIPWHSFMFCAHSHKCKCISLEFNVIEQKVVHHCEVEDKSIEKNGIWKHGYYF